MPRIETVKLYSDGACEGNPGQGAIGCLVLDENNQELDSYSECVGYTTNNRAEYLALIKGLECAARHTRNTVHCYLDSELVVKQLNKVDFPTLGRPTRATIGRFMLIYGFGVGVGRGE